MTSALTLEIIIRDERPLKVLTEQEPDENDKTKAAFNLSDKILEELEDKWHKIRKLMGSKQITKTLIVERAFELAFEEFDHRGEESDLYSRLP